jgi:hypothetical protein
MGAIDTTKTVGGKIGSKLGGAAIVGGFVGDVLNVGMTAGTFKASQEEGDHFAVSVAKAGIEFGVNEAFYGAMFNGGFIKGIGGVLAMSGVSAAANLEAKRMENSAQIIGQASKNASGIGSGYFDMTQTGYTMRQRSLNAIRSNGANINSSFGNEARNYYLGI